MPSKHVAIAEAVKDALNNATLAHDFIAERKYPGAIERTDVERLADVFVFPVGHTWEYINRKITSQHEYAVQVVVRATIDVGSDEYDQDQIDDLLLLMEGIGDTLRDGGRMAGATLMSGTNDPIFDPEYLDKHLFYAGLTFNYSIGRNA